MTLKRLFGRFYLKSLLDVLLGPLGGRLVELHDAEGGEDPGASGRQDVGVGEVQPLVNEGLESNQTRSYSFRSATLPAYQLIKQLPISIISSFRC